MKSIRPVRGCGISEITTYKGVKIMKKKILSTVLALSVAVGMTACGGSEPAANAGNDGGNAAVETTTSAEVTDAGASDAGATQEPEEPEVIEEPAVPELPDGYERYTLSNDTFGIEVSFPVKTGEVISELSDKISVYEDEAKEGWYISYKLYNVCPHSLDDSTYTYDMENNTVYESDAGYDVVLSLDQPDWKSIRIYGDDYLNGRMVAEIEISGSQQRMTDEQLLDEVALVAKYVQIKETGSNQLYTADGKFQSAADYITIDPKITVDGQTFDNGWFCESTGYPYSGVEFTSSEGENVSIKEKGGYGGTIYAARVDDDDYTQVEIGGYPAIRKVYNTGGNLIAYYIILLGHDAKDYEENFEVYVTVDGNFESTFLKDLINGVTESDLFDRMDSYLNDYMNSVTYTPSVTE